MALSNQLHERKQVTPVQLKVPCIELLFSGVSWYGILAIARVGIIALFHTADNDMITAPEDRVNMTSVAGAFMLKLSQLAKQTLNLKWTLEFQDWNSWLVLTLNLPFASHLPNAEGLVFHLISCSVFVLEHQTQQTHFDHYPPSNCHSHISPLVPSRLLLHWPVSCWQPWNRSFF